MIWLTTIEDVVIILKMIIHEKNKNMNINALNTIL